ncbi:LpxI family protein [Halonatronum saccharophilum]|uniref:LpxI family protein n=1 Tax=Halonatronum saccharophilum TaxID=150060 RepID=UPI00048A0D9D|nr:UDP-2,3-diacylglucosamine diphosphatase LpxI [Halonatronum saccharophilum]
MAKIGLIAGDGNLPLLFAQGAKSKGINLVGITVTTKAKKQELQSLLDVCHHIEVGQLSKIINILLDEGVNEVIMLGKVSKELLYQGVELDDRFKRLIYSLKEKNDDAIMLAIVKELMDSGIKVVDQTQLIERLLPQAGTLTNTKVEEDILDDMRYGFKMAKEIGGLDIGQTVVVKDGAVMAVEAIEGTDQAILRGGQLGANEVVVAKVSKPNQDLRFDIPTVGLDTLENLINVEARGLVIEAGKTFVVNQEEFIKRADKHGIAVVAMSSIEN